MDSAAPKSTPALTSTETANTAPEKGLLRYTHVDDAASHAWYST